MPKLTEKITMPSGREVRRFILPPGPVRDGTYRCIRCGQIDDSPWHDAAICAAMGQGTAAIVAGRLVIPIDVRANDGSSQRVYRMDNFAQAEWTGSFWAYPRDDGPDGPGPYPIDFEPTHYWPKPESAPDA